MSIHVAMPWLYKYERNGNLHFIRDLPPIRKHTRARMILGEHIDGLSKTLESESEGE